MLYSGLTPVYSILYNAYVANTAPLALREDTVVSNVAFEQAYRVDT